MTARGRLIAAFWLAAAIILFGGLWASTVSVMVYEAFGAPKMPLAAGLMIGPALTALLVVLGAGLLWRRGRWQPALVVLGIADALVLTVAGWTMGLV